MHAYIHKEYLCHKWPRIGLITGFVTRLTLVEQELPTLPKQLSSPPVFSGVRVARSLVLCVWFVDRCLSFFLWPLCYLSFFDLRILITSLYIIKLFLRRATMQLLMVNKAQQHSSNINKYSLPFMYHFVVVIFWKAETIIDSFVC